MKFFEVSRPGETVRITIPIRDQELVAIIEENITIAENLKACAQTNWEEIKKIRPPHRDSSRLL